MGSAWQPVELVITELVSMVGCPASCTHCSEDAAANGGYIVRPSFACRGAIGPSMWALRVCERHQFHEDGGIEHA